MIIKNSPILLFICCCLFTLQSSAQENVVAEEIESKVAVVDATNIENDTVPNTKQQASLETNVIAKTPEVGKHVMANMDAGSMILSLLMVLVLIGICAFILKRFNFAQQTVSQLRVVTSLSVGAKERVIVVQMGEQQLLLGVTAQQITLLDKLAEPLTEPTINAADLPKNLLSFLSNPRR